MGVNHIIQQKRFLQRIHEALLRHTDAHTKGHVSVVKFVYSFINILSKSVYLLIYCQSYSF